MGQVQRTVDIMANSCTQLQHKVSEFLKDQVQFSQLPDATQPVYTLAARVLAVKVPRNGCVSPKSVIFTHTFIYTHTHTHTTRIVQIWSLGCGRTGNTAWSQYAQWHVTQMLAHTSCHCRQA